MTWHPWKVGSSVETSVSRSSLIHAPESVPMGVVERGGVGRAEIVVANSGDSLVVIDHIESSCECLTIEPRSIRLGPGESSVLRVVFDSSRELDFVGELGIEVTAREASGTISFRTMVDVEVESPRTGGLDTVRTHAREGVTR